MPAELPLELSTAALVLLAERAVWWPQQRALLVADVHLGKDAVFRAHGLPIPSGSTTHDLQRLTALCRDYDAARLIVLGDLVHGRLEPAVAAEITAWRDGLAGVDVRLVRGNHDRHLGRLPGAWRIRDSADYRLGGLHLVHAPSARADRAELAGHLHPVCRLHDGRADALRVPVFWLHEQRLVLPAFGSFTGGHAVVPQAGDRLFAVGPGELVEVAPG